MYKVDPGFPYRMAHPARILASLAGVALLVATQAAAAARTLPDFTGLVNENRTAVVNISTTQKVKQRLIPEGFENLPKDSPFYEFYRRFFEGREPPPQRDVTSLGSGFIISPDGYVITNNHVIKDADEIIVRLSDRREFEAKIIGADERSDLALLKIGAENLPVVKLGTDYALKVGEWVLAIGSPFGFDYSVTAGIVSAMGRSLPRENYVPFIQTDVAINPGNSGGPLFNLDGEVVGVNSQIYTRTGAYSGLSFAIPIDVAMDVVDQLRARGRVSRGWLGVLIQDVTSELAESFGMEKPAGALVAKVLDDSPADRAGFQVGDIVLAFNGHEVQRSSDLPPVVGRTRVDTKTPVKILRNGKSLTLQVVIAELPEDDEIRVATAARPGTVRENKLGIVVSDLTAEQRKKLGVEEDGVVIANLRDGPAKEGGLQKGDVIIMLNNARVKDSAHFKKLASELPSGKAVSILVQRQGNPIFLALKTEK